MRKRWSRIIPLAGALALMTANASAQMPMPGVHLGGEQKRPLTPEEKERQKQLDDDYKAATNKTPDQKANDPWGFVRPAPTVPAPKKKQIAANIAKLPELLRKPTCARACCITAKLHLPGSVVMEQILRNWLVAIG